MPLLRRALVVLLLAGSACVGTGCGPLGDRPGGPVGLLSEAFAIGPEVWHLPGWLAEVCAGVSERGARCVPTAGSDSVAASGEARVLRARAPDRSVDVLVRTRESRGTVAHELRGRVPLQGRPHVVSLVFTSREQADARGAEREESVRGFVVGPHGATELNEVCYGRRDGERSEVRYYQTLDNCWTTEDARHCVAHGLLEVAVGGDGVRASVEGTFSRDHAPWGALEVHRAGDVVELSVASPEGGHLQLPTTCLEHLLHPSSVLSFGAGVFR